MLEKHGRLYGRRSARQFFDTPPGRIEVRFRHAAYDWLQMRVTARGPELTVRYVDEAMKQVGVERFPSGRQTISCRLSSVLCPFRDLVAWLEAMTTSVMQCGFEWEGEGPDGSIGWNGRLFSVFWGQTNRGTGAYEKRKLEVLADRAQVIRAFYTAFRRFVESPEYRPERYENLSAGEEMVIALERNYTVEELRGLLLKMDAQGVEETLQKLRPMGYTTVAGMEPGELGAWEAAVDALIAERKGAVSERVLRTVRTPYITGPWNRWNTAKRRACLEDIFTFRSVGGGLGSPLRAMRSEMVERWLGWGAPTHARPVANGD